MRSYCDLKSTKPFQAATDCSTGCSARPIKIDPAITITAEPAYLNSVFENLLSNTIKYCRPDSKTIAVKATIEAGTAIITFKDRGKGIDLQSYGDQLFHMFATFHGTSDSKGLGLYLVKKYIDSIGGQITVESAIGENSYTVFNIRLPILQ